MYKSTAESFAAWSFAASEQGRGGSNALIYDSPLAGVPWICNSVIATVGV